MIIGREAEIEKLNELYDSGSAEMVALYGRRRVGKTYLVDEVLGERITFRHAGLSPIDGRYASETKRKSRMKDQLKHFYRSLTTQGYSGEKTPETWLDAFYMLEDFLAGFDDKKRILIFIDEIQWLDTPKASFMTGLEAFWNGWACHKHNVMLIVCGSSTSWILDKLVNNHGGLYGRLTYQMKLLPFSLHECELYFSAKGIEMSRYDIVQAYMLAGGIPYYLNYFRRELSLPQSIDAMFFSGTAPLHGEFDRLFSSLFSNPETMKAIVIALNSKNRGLTRQEIISSTGIADSGDLSHLLEALIAGSFVIRYCSFGNGRKEEYYKLVDPFCNFWLHFVADSGKSTNWTSLSDTQQAVAWRGYAFENVCFNHISQIKAALGISGVSTSESMWSKKGSEDFEGAQIDLIISRKDNVVNMCEIKYCSDEFAVNKDYHFTLVRRKTLLNEIIPKKAVVHSTLITTFGLKRSEYSTDFIHVLTLEDLFAENRY